MIYSNCSYRPSDKRKEHKRVLSSLLAISILFSFSLTASAVDKTTEIKHTIDITHVSPEDRDSLVEKTVLCDDMYFQTILAAKPELVKL